VWIAGFCQKSIGSEHLVDKLAEIHVKPTFRAAGRGANMRRRDFIRMLGATYRYVLDCRGRALVPLADELEALERHRVLADIRYQGSVRLEVDVPRADAQQLLLPPVSLAELFQNALKHNVIAPDLQLTIRVRVEDATLVFENDLRSGPKSARSTGTGLVNLRERFRIVTGRAAVWVAEGNRFVVRLPLVRNSSSVSSS